MQKLVNTIIILMVVEGIVKSMNDLDWNGRLNLLWISICICFPLLVWRFHLIIKNMISFNSEKKKAKSQKQIRSGKNKRYDCLI
jgi:hypothetical protein